MASKVLSEYVLLFFHRSSTLDMLHKNILDNGCENHKIHFKQKLSIIIIDETINEKFDAT